MSTPPAGADTPAVEARGLEKRYGALAAVRGIDVVLARGEFLAVFGPNGAGKSTLLRMLCGAVVPSRGTVRIAGEEIGGGEDGWRRRIGLLSHQTFLYPGLSAAENLDFYARLYGLADRRARVDEALRGVELWDRRADAARTFSRGMQQRLALARTLLHDPEVVFLDEPYTGLDPHASGLLTGVLERLRDGRRTIVLVTHNLSQGLEQANRVAVQVGGRWVSDEPASAIDPATWERVYTERVAAAR
ncbi:heme ABC exporter ATP-binding protein CcmA [Longimicrobium terrae]|uniref:Heme exporter protein A n=1 Tax=Longimicrobium terrae TaxID=1639882 RepID=A0A841H4Z8_9BACT|nr:heme exporter protein A [Longimicrobium terrae]MBB6073043.1 heme exporter protein A [Longimicrobium terrae]NNC33166.1 heme ABC exporter ATP-binding protein CcmA [Longimicrobium terrae]